MKIIKEFYIDMFASHYQLLEKRGVSDATFDVILNMSLSITLNISSLFLFSFYFLSIKTYLSPYAIGLGVFFLIYILVFLRIYWWYNYSESIKKEVINRTPKHKPIFYFIYKIISVIILVFAAYLISL